METIVGSILWTGGSAATILPIIGFVFLWITKNGKLKQKDWAIIVGLLFIGFISYKRAIWFIMPIIIFLFMVYIPMRKFKISYLFFILILSPIIFYLGVRLNPSLNKENELWGSFDYNFVTDYASSYSFGEEESGKRETGQGRGGATFLLFSNISNNDFYTENNFIGYGCDEIYTKDYNTFDKDKFGVSNKGAVTGIFQSYITIGYIGIITFLFYALSLIFHIKNFRIKIVLIGFFCWEYFFYAGILFRIQALTILFIYCIIYLNLFNYKRKIIA